MLLDRYERNITYLRVSVTDRCNFRCVYCMPEEGIDWRPHAEILTFTEIIEIVRVAVGLGITKVRVTGGEPLVRRDLPVLIRGIAGLDGIEDLSITTNALLLEKFAGPLQDAGLQRINVSLDTLDPDKFARITRGGSLDLVWRGLRAAEKAGLGPVKLNAVVIRDFNTDELLDFARLSLDHPWQVRFIELMPVSNSQDWGDGFPTGKDRFVSSAEILEKLKTLGLKSVPDQAGNGPARVYQIPGAMGTVGIISPVGDHFCKTCNRLRLTADGNLRPCLLNNHEVSLRDVLRRGEDITPYFHQVIREKPVGHTLNEEIDQDFSRKMAQVGG